eukprot:scaffold34916_cov170-Amphora_coffeaeformis.AAC.14
MDVYAMFSDTKVTRSHSLPIFISVWVIVPGHFVGDNFVHLAGMVSIYSPFHYNIYLTGPSKGCHSHQLRMDAASSAWCYSMVPYHLYVRRHVHEFKFKAIRRGIGLIVNNDFDTCLGCSDIVGFIAGGGCGCRNKRLIFLPWSAIPSTPSSTR